MKNSKPTFISLCSGCGGMDLGLERSGMKCVGQVEIMPYALKVLKKHWPEVPKWDDIKSLDTACLDMLLSHPEEVRSMAGKLKKVTPTQVKEMIISYNEGMSLQDLAHIYGVTRQAVWWLLKSRNVKMRPQLRYGEENHFYRGGKRADKYANDKLEYAITKGEIANPGKCSKCGSDEKFLDGRTAIQGHHPDYNKPLEIMWLCQKCHYLWHKTNTTIAKKGGTNGTRKKVDLIAFGFP